MKHIKKHLPIIILIAVFVFVDLRSKTLMSHYYASMGPLFTYVLNTQAARNIPIPLWIINSVSCLAILLCAIIYMRGYIGKRASIFIIAGALGNLYDRIVFSGVRDRINIRIIPVFNIADILITVGVCVFIFADYKRTKGKH